MGVLLFERILTTTQGVDIQRSKILLGSGGEKFVIAQAYFVMLGCGRVLLTKIYQPFSVPLYILVHVTAFYTMQTRLGRN